MTPTPLFVRDDWGATHTKHPIAAVIDIEIDRSVGWFTGELEASQQRFGKLLEIVKAIASALPADAQREVVGEFYGWEEKQ